MSEAFQAQAPGIVVREQWIKKLGEGTFGEVALVKRYHDDRPGNVLFMAVKTVRSNDLLDGLNKEIFEHEMRILNEKLKEPKTDNIVEYFGPVKTPKGELGLAFEYCEKGDLRSVGEALKRKDPRDIEKLLIKYCQDINVGLFYLHEHAHIAHRDMKPDNILITKCDTAKIGDMGFAMELEEGKEMVSASRWGGTREYKAPETSENIVGYPSDIFSTGVLFIEVFNRMRRPWTALRNSELKRLLKTDEETKKRYYKQLGSSMKDKKRVYFTVDDIFADEAANTEKIEWLLRREKHYRLAKTIEKGVPWERLSLTRNYPKALVDTLKKMLDPAWAERPTAADLISDPDSFFKMDVEEPNVPSETESGGASTTASNLDGIPDMPSIEYWERKLMDEGAASASPSRHVQRGSTVNEPVSADLTATLPIRGSRDTTRAKAPKHVTFGQPEQQSVSKGKPPSEEATPGIEDRIGDPVANVKEGEVVVRPKRSVKKGGPGMAGLVDLFISQKKQKKIQDNALKRRARLAEQGKQRKGRINSTTSRPVTSGETKHKDGERVQEASSRRGDAEVEQPGNGSRSRRNRPSGRDGEKHRRHSERR